MKQGGYRALAGALALSSLLGTGCAYRGREAGSLVPDDPRGRYYWCVKEKPDSRGPTKCMDIWLFGVYDDPIVTSEPVMSFELAADPGLAKKDFERGISKGLRGVGVKPGREFIHSLYDEYMSRSLRGDSNKRVRMRLECTEPDCSLR